MRIYNGKNVLEAARERIRYIFAEFPNIVCSVSGGKDSTVIFHLALEAARELGRLPLKVFFLDQEAEWQSTIDQMRLWMYHEDVEPMWMQFPFRLFNATSASEHWLNCWAPEDEHRWMREREPISYKENVYGTDRFHELFPAISAYHFKDQPVAFLRGMRCEESPTRLFAMTSTLKYKWITWGKRLNEKMGHYCFDPLYDWFYSDVWKAIHEHGWPYNTLYDMQYRYGISIKNMRVSNVHHETAVMSLFYLQEFEPETYERLTQRISGIDMAGKMGKDDYFVSELPFAFSSWKEYRDYLLENLITVPEWRMKLARMFEVQEKKIPDESVERIVKAQIGSILTNDWEGIKLGNTVNAVKVKRMLNSGQGKRPIRSGATA